MTGQILSTVGYLVLNDKSVLAVIPARGGSKRLPGKNVMDLGGKPLINWSIEAALQSKYIDDIVVTSDCDKILEISSEFNVCTIKRPNYLAEDTSSSTDVVKHAINAVVKYGKKHDLVILLQPTSPLRNHVDIDSSFNNFLDSGASSLISTYRTSSKILKTFSNNDNGFIECVSSNRYPFMREQDLPDVYMSNGAIYIVDIENFLSSGSFYTSKTMGYVMSKDKSIDIDTLDDFIKVKNLIDL